MHLMVQFSGRNTTVRPPVQKQLTGHSPPLKFTKIRLNTWDIVLYIIYRLYRYIFLHSLSHVCCITLNYTIARRNVTKDYCLFLPKCCILINKAFILKYIISTFNILIILNSYTSGTSCIGKIEISVFFLLLFF